MKIRRIHVTIHLSKRAKVALCVRCEQAQISAGTICRAAIEARYKTETGNDLPVDEFQPAGRRTMNPESTSVCVIMADEWLDLIEAHAPGKARSWVAQSVAIHLGFPPTDTKQRKPGVRPTRSCPAFIEACEAESHWPAGRVLMRGAITGRHYLGHAA